MSSEKDLLVFAAAKEAIRKPEREQFESTGIQLDHAQPTVFTAGFLAGAAWQREHIREHEGCNYHAAILCNKCGWFGQQIESPERTEKENK